MSMPAAVALATHYHLGPPLCAAPVLTMEPLAPGNEETLRALQDPARKPTRAPPRPCPPPATSVRFRAAVWSICGCSWTQRGMRSSRPPGATGCRGAAFGPLSERPLGCREAGARVTVNTRLADTTWNTALAPPPFLICCPAPEGARQWGPEIFSVLHNLACARAPARARLAGGVADAPPVPAVRLRLSRGLPFWTRSS